MYTPTNTATNAGLAPTLPPKAEFVYKGPPCHAEHSHRKSAQTVS